MSYQKILEALNQELVCVDRAIAFLMKASGYNLSSADVQVEPDSPDQEVELHLRASAQRRAGNRQQILAELRAEQGLLMSAIESIHKLAQSSGY